MSKYKSLLDPVETEKAIGKIKDFFQTNLALELNLIRVTAPLFVEKGTGVNDDLNGVEKPISFKMGAAPDVEIEVVQSLAKWKRMKLADLGTDIGKGLYADMNALRPDDLVDEIHSLYVDQWDWERAMAESDRNLDFLKMIVRKVYDVIRRTERYVYHEYQGIEPVLPENITFVHTEDLESEYPDLSPAERETEACRKHGAIFVIGIGGSLKNSEYHDGRAPDYDDWSTPTDDGHKGLNGDIVVYNPILERGYELSSMGIRVSPESLERQLEIRGTTERKELMFHKRLLNGELPFSIGGGIGQSRLCMFYLRKAHIGEIQASVWPKDMIAECKESGIHLL
jgi:aspartate--ammonia ligase